MFELNDLSQEMLKKSNTFAFDIFKLRTYSDGKELESTLIHLLQ